MTEKKIVNEHKKLAGGQSKPWYQKFTVTSKMREGWIICLVTLSAVTIAGLLYAKGYESGRKNTKETVVSPLDAFSAPFERIHTGTVEKITDTQITVKTPSQELSFIITSETKIRQGKEDRQVKDIQEGKRVTVIRVSDKNSKDVSQIILR